MSRLQRSPQFAELPFPINARITEPMVDVRVAVSNLKRAMGPCMEPVHDPAVPALVVPILGPQLGAKFL